MSICDWFSKWRYDKALKRGMDALDERDREFDELCAKAGDFEEFKRQLYPRTYVALHTCPPFEGNPSGVRKWRKVSIQEIRDEMDNIYSIADGDYELYRDQDGVLRKRKPEPKPDTVESVLNQFIALGYDKPEVVIKGFTTHGGGGEFRATIDGNPVVWVKLIATCISEQTDVFSSIESAEEKVLRELKVKLNKLPVDTIEITY